uniref:DnaJ homolog subfamily C member 1 n=1 Tax=Ornithorhynchus anatinus TaxID=9258 RepID=A0A6I8N5H4_ORNAN
MSAPGPRAPPLLLPLLLLLLGPVPAPVRGWESGDLELFDLVEEVQLNFYHFLGVQQDASSADIRKAYRKLSLTLHPDKNKDENAETQFRQLVAIYEVLKDEERRQRYDDVLINGLPDWRQPVFYYRRVRKMSNAELALLLFIILTVGHYAVVWSIYLEKQLDELLSRKKRDKKKKSSCKSVDKVKLGAIEKNERLLVKPQWHDLLPCKLGIWFCLTLKSLPHLIQAPDWTEEDLRQLTRSMVKFPGGTPGRWEKIAHELGRSVTDVTSKAKQLKDLVTCAPGMVKLSELKSTAQNSKPAKAAVTVPDHLITQRDEEEEEKEEEEEEEEQDEEVGVTPVDPTETPVPESRPRRRKPARGPGPNATARDTPDDKIRGRRQKDFDLTEQDEPSDEDSRKREKSRPAEELWTQNQQKLLEVALQQYPKGTPERWDRIARCVPDRTKEECVARYKLLVELVQKKKLAKS